MLAPAPSLRGIERLRRAVWIASGLGGAALAGFHGWLLASQFAAGRLADPELALRWLIAGALVAGLAALHRSSGSIWSRRGVAIWILAALLHGPAVAAKAADPSGVLALPESVATVIAQVAATAASLALGLWILGGLLGSVFQRPGLRLVPVVAAVRERAHPNSRPFSPRPPPRF